MNIGLSYGLFSGLNAVLYVGLNNVVEAGLSFGIISLLVSLTLSAQTGVITLSERLRWTWSSLMRGLLTPKHVKEAFLVTSIIGLSYWLNDGLEGGLSRGLGIGLLYWLLLGLFQGIESSRIEDQARRLPNQGIRRSLYNSVLLALISSAIIDLSYGLYFGLRGVLYVGLRAMLFSELNSLWLTGLSVGLTLAVCGGLLVCASRGGLAVLRHYVIRFLLARSHSFPWHAPRFLEEATTRILLCRVGGGYSFPHRLLLDYFANLDQGPPPSPPS